MIILTSWNDDGNQNEESSSSSWTRHTERVLHRFLGPYEFVYFQHTESSRKWRQSVHEQLSLSSSFMNHLPHRHGTNNLLHHLGATTTQDMQKLQTLYATHPDDFWTWCRNAAQYHVDAWGEYPLHRACRYGNVTDVRALLELYPTAVSLSGGKEGNLPLHCALLANNKDVVYLLITVYPEALHVMNEQQGLPLHVAIASSCSDILVKILWHCYPGALAVSSRSGQNQTPLHLIFRHKCFRQDHCTLRWWVNQIPQDDLGTKLLKQALLQRDAQGRLPVHVAIENNPSPTCLHELWAWASQEVWSAVDNDGRTPLHVACQQGNYITIADVVYILLQASPDALDIMDRHGRLPIHVALQHGATEDIIEQLLPHYRNQSTQQQHGPWKSLCEMAAEHGASVSVMFLLLRENPEVIEQWATV